MHTKIHFKLEPMIQNHFNIGTIVYLMDGSYMIKKGGNNDDEAYMLTHSNHLFQVIGINKPYPTDLTFSAHSAAVINNIKIQSITSGEVFYCSNLNITSICCGNQLDTGYNCCSFLLDEYKEIKEVFSDKEEYPYFKPALTKICEPGINSYNFDDDFDY